MTTITELRARARAALGGQIFANNWIMALLILLVMGIIATIIPGLGTIILLGPCSFGTAAVMLKLSRGSTADFNDAFSGFTGNDVGGNIVLGFMTGLFIFLWSLLFVIPGIVKSYAYSMVYYVKNDHPEMDWRACQAESSRIMNGYKMKLFLLDLSFIGWYIVGMLAFGVGTLWVNAYNEAARAAFYEDIKNVPDVKI